MELQPIHLEKMLLDCGARRYPDSDFEGLFHNIGFDWSMFKVDADTFFDRLHDLSVVIGTVMVNGILLQLIWRVPEGREAEEKFLRAVFGEVHYAEPRHC